MKIEEMPQEVMWVMVLPKYLGSENYIEAQRIIEKYPEWFSQEHIYRNIPEAVKTQFEAEKSLLRDSFFPRVAMEHVPGEGIMGYLRRIEEINKSLPVKTLEESLNYIFEERPKKEKAYQKALVKLHNKHYKKYKYKFE